MSVFSLNVIKIFYVIEQNFLNDLNMHTCMDTGGDSHGHTRIHAHT